MGVNHRGRRFAVSVWKCTFAVLLLSLTATWIISNSGEVAAQPPCKPRKSFMRPILRGCPGDECNVCETLGATWYWLRSPDEEKRAVAALFNRYCIRCHGVDGRGVWDIPDVPNFTNSRWQACRSNGQLARIILEGRGAVMPPFRGTLSLEEACAVGRYLRTFVPGTEVSRPNLDSSPHSAVPPPAAKPTRRNRASLSDSSLPTPIPSP